MRLHEWESLISKSLVPQPFLERHSDDDDRSLGLLALLFLLLWGLGYLLQYTMVVASTKFYNQKFNENPEAR